MWPNEMKSRANSADTLEQFNGVGGGRKSSFSHVIITPPPTIAPLLPFVVKLEATDI